MQTELFIEGRFVPASDGATAPTLNPTTTAGSRAPVAQARGCDRSRADELAKLESILAIANGTEYGQGGGLWKSVWVNVDAQLPPYYPR